jgi:hypothetical protein
MSLEDATDAAAFETYVEHYFLALTLRKRQVVWSWTICRPQELEGRELI